MTDRRKDGTGVRHRIAVLCGAAGLLFGIAGPAAGQQTLTGCWVGTVGAGANLRRAALDADRGTLHVMGRTVSADSLRAMSHTGDSITFHVVTAQGDMRFSGAVGSDGVFAGTLAREGQNHPFRLIRAGRAPDPASVLLGYWRGGLEMNGAIVLRIGLEFAPAPCGQVHVTMDSPDQGAENLPVTSLALTGDSLRFAMDYLNGSFDGAVSADRRAITGSWTQGPGTLELQLTRGDTTTFRRPQEPEPPYPYDTLAVTYENAAGGVRFAGTLTLPRGDGPFPAVLLLTGSGAQNRDEALMGHRPFLIIADHLTRRGIATLRVDDRGIGGSTGNVMTATIDDNAGDALAGVAFLERQPRVDGRRIGLLGHSEGGWVAPLAATRSADIAFLVLLAGPSVTGEEIMHAQDSVISLLNGASLDHVAANRVASEALFAALRAEPNDSLAIPHMRAAVDSVVATLSADQQRRLDSAWAGVDRERAWQPLATPWFRYLLTYDPRPVLARVTVPVLALFGEKDVQVPPGQNVPPMRHAFAAAANPDATVRVVPGVNHLFQHAETGLIAEYARIEETMAPAVLEEIATWIVQRFGRAGR